ncbi:MAG TPA: DNA mismatch repair protein MutT [Actinobacteria bacterium]|nr:DNA mismatch repair protein MutT [Actinomycetota bacterium]
MTVAGAAIFDERGCLLAARRTLPAHVAGKWEFPGGKVEDGETDIEGLRREIYEELGVEIAVGERIGGDWALGPGFVLRLWRCTITHGEPAPLEDHDELRWLEPGDWFSVDWLPADLPIVELIAAQS